MSWLERLNARVRFKEPLHTHTTFHIGGPADVWIEPENYQELRRIICHCHKEKIPYLVIGRGSNILVSDRGFPGIVVCLNSPFFTKIKVKGTCMTCGAGLSLKRLLQIAQKRGMAGVEFLAGIPASTAGALVMNAGSQGKSIGDLVKSVTAMDGKGKIRVLKDRQLRFGYRQSNLDRYVILETVLKLEKRSPQKIRENILANLSHKRKTQDLISKSAGCIFKNPQHRLSAGEMIEACGLKSTRRGGAEISAKHANYFINRNGAKARDILSLLDLAQREVKKKFGVHLEPEIKIMK